MNPMTTAITSSKPKDIVSLLDRQKGELTKALGSQIPADFFVRVALTAMRKNPLLYQCTQDSLMQCMMDLAQIRLVPDSITGEAYLIPFKDGRSGRYECQLMIGYQGYLKMVRRSSNVTNVYASVVYANDEFDISFGSDRHMNHKPKIGGGRGRWLGAVGYVAFEREGVKGEDFVWIDSEYIERVKKQARGSSSAASPWAQWPEAMWAKTALKQLCKTADLSPDVRETVARAAELDGAIDVPASVDTEPSPSDLTKETLQAPITPEAQQEKPRARRRRAPNPEPENEGSQGDQEEVVGVDAEGSEPSGDSPELFQ